MQLRFKQRLFSWFDSYDIYDEFGNTVYVVKGQLSWGHCLKIFDSAGRELGMVKERILALLPKYELYLEGSRIGCISKELTIFKPKYNIDCKGWTVEGSITEWNYTIYAPGRYEVANIYKEIFRLTDTYIINVMNPEDAIYALMLVLAIDAEKCSRDN